MVTQGMKDGFAVALGSGVNSFVASKVPFGQTSAIGQGAVKVLTATVTGMLVKKLTRSDRFAAFYVAGAYADVIKGALSGVPVVGQFMGSYYRPALPAGGGMGSYFRAPAAATALSGYDGLGRANINEMNQFSDQQNEDDSGDDSFMMG